MTGSRNKENHMNVNGLINMLTRMFVKQAMDSGIDYLSRRGKPDKDLNPEEREQTEDTKSMADKARKGARLAGRFLR